MINLINQNLTNSLGRGYYNPYLMGDNGTPVTSFKNSDKVFAYNVDALKVKNQSRTTRTSIFYINDFHGKAINMERTITASNEFDRYTPTEQIDKLKLSSGDIMLGQDVATNRVAISFMKIAGITASAVGNHECDMKSADFFNEVPNMPTKLLACNVKAGMTSKIAKYIQKSCIQDVNGTKYGIIGTIPSDLISRIKYGKVFQDQDIQPADINETISAVQAEVNKLKSQGVNKIILLSHSGYGYDKKIAQNTEGIDVILGGHSHNLIKGITNGENLLYSKSGEPVIITQAGRDGKYFGILNLEFDKDGIITKAQNNVATTREFSRNAIARYLFEKIKGKPEVIGKIRTAPPILKNDLIEPNPLAYYGLDSMREITGADIALVGASNLRGCVEKGDIDTGVIEEISPFKNKIIKVNYTEKEIVEALKFSAKSLTNRNNKPGIMYTSGLTYLIHKDGTISDLKYIDKNGNVSSIDVNNPREEKLYSTAINDYYSSGNDGLDMLNKYFEATERYKWDINYAIEQKIRNTKEPIDIVDDGRIKIEK